MSNDNNSDRVQQQAQQQATQQAQVTALVGLAADSGFDSWVAVTTQENAPWPK